MAGSFRVEPLGTETSMQVFCKFLATMTICVLASGGAIAQNSNYYGQLPPNPPQSWLAQGRSVQEWHRYRYDYSGTRGRMASAPTRLTRKVPVIFHRRAGSFGQVQQINFG